MKKRSQTQKNTPKTTACTGNSTTAETSLQLPGADQGGSRVKLTGGDGLAGELSVETAMFGILNVSGHMGFKTV